MATKKRKTPDEPTPTPPIANRRMWADLQRLSPTPPIVNHRAGADLERYRHGSPSVKLQIERDTFARWYGADLRTVRERREAQHHGGHPWATWHDEVLAFADAHPAGLQGIWTKLRLHVLAARQQDTTGAVVNVLNEKEIVDETLNVPKPECHYVVGRPCVLGPHLHWQPGPAADTESQPPLRTASQTTVFNLIRTHRHRRRA
jgi:hypothetical protein